MLQNSPLLATLLTNWLQGVCNKLFKRICITWYFKKGINRPVDKFLWRDQNLTKKDILFSPIYYQKQPPKGALQNSCSALNGQKPWKIRFKDVYIQILVLSIFETNQEVTILKKPREKLINWYVRFALQNPSTTELSC